MDASCETLGQPENLVSEIASGKKIAEQRLVEKYWRGLFFILNKRTNDSDLAADLAQDALIIVIENARSGKIENPAALSGYVRQVGVNLMIAHYRKEKRRNTHVDSDLQLNIPDDSPSIYRFIYSEKILERVQQLINEMSVERDRDILQSYFIQEKSKKEICGKLDISPAHFDRVLFRARQRLKQLVLLKLGDSPGKGTIKEILSIVLIFALIKLFSTSHMNQDKKKNSIMARGFFPSQHLTNKHVNQSTASSFNNHYIERRVG